MGGWEVWGLGDLWLTKYQKLSICEQREHFA